jgi:hypothetical protein
VEQGIDFNESCEPVDFFLHFIYSELIVKKKVRKKKKKKEKNT